MRTCKPGDKVTCLHAVEAYYSNYSGNPCWVFSPGMTAIVAAICPKVRLNRGRKLTGAPLYDNRETFIVADYIDAEGKSQRVALNFINARKVKQ